LVCKSAHFCAEELVVEAAGDAEHGGAAVLDLHDLVAAHVTRLNEAERVVDAEGREDAEVTRGEHGGANGLGGGFEGRRH